MHLIEIHGVSPVTAKRQGKGHLKSGAKRNAPKKSVNETGFYREMSKEGWSQHNILTDVPGPEKMYEGTSEFAQPLIDTAGDGEAYKIQAQP